MYEPVKREMGQDALTYSGLIRERRCGMSEHKKKIKEWLDANVNDGDDRSGSSDRLYFNPDELQELVCELYEDVFAEENAELKEWKSFAEDEMNEYQGREIPNSCGPREYIHFQSLVIQRDFSQ